MTRQLCEAKPESLVGKFQRVQKEVFHIMPITACVHTISTHRIQISGIDM